MSVVLPYAECSRPKLNRLAVQVGPHESPFAAQSNDATAVQATQMPDACLSCGRQNFSGVRAARTICKKTLKRKEKMEVALFCEEVPSLRRPTGELAKFG